MAKYIFTLPVGAIIGTASLKKQWDKDGVAVVEANNIRDARNLMFLKFGSVWAGEYNFETFGLWEHFPKGIIHNLKVVNKKQFPNSNVSYEGRGIMPSEPQNELF